MWARLIQEVLWYKFEEFVFKFLRAAYPSLEFSKKADCSLAPQGTESEREQCLQQTGVINMALCRNCANSQPSWKGLFARNVTYKQPSWNHYHEQCGYNQLLHKTNIMIRTVPYEGIVQIFIMEISVRGNCTKQPSWKRAVWTNCANSRHKKGCLNK